MAIASNTVSTMQNRHILTDYAMCLIMLFTVKELDSSDSKLPVTIHGVVCSGCSLPGCDTTYFHVWAPTLRSDKQSSNSQLKWGAPHPPHFDPTDKGSVFFHDQVSQLRKQQYGLLTFWYIVGNTKVNNINLQESILQCFILSWKCFILSWMFVSFYILFYTSSLTSFKNNQHDVTCGLSFIFMGSRHSLSTCFELSGSSSSGDHFPCTVSLWYSV